MHVYDVIENKWNTPARNYKHAEKNAPISKVCDCLFLNTYLGTEDCFQVKSDQKGSPTPSPFNLIT